MCSFFYSPFDFASLPYSQPRRRRPDYSQSPYYSQSDVADIFDFDALRQPLPRSARPTYHETFDPVFTLPRHYPSKHSKRTSQSKRSFPVPVNRLSQQAQATSSIAIFDKIKAGLAARKIQRAFRTYSSRRKDAAAKVIQRGWRAHSARIKVLPIVASLRKLQVVRSTYALILEDHANFRSVPLQFKNGELVRGLENKLYLSFEDALIKLLCQLDAIEVHDLTCLRDQRRKFVKMIEKKLAELDEYKEFQRSFATEGKQDMDGHSRRSSVSCTSCEGLDSSVDWNELERKIEDDSWNCSARNDLVCVAWPCPVSG